MTFTFTAANAEETTVRIHVTGFPSTQEGLNHAFNECNGWTEFLTLLKRYAENI